MVYFNGIFQKKDIDKEPLTPLMVGGLLTSLQEGFPNTKEETKRLVCLHIASELL